MQIRATVKWRQSLPLTRAAANHPPRPHPSSRRSLSPSPIPSQSTGPRRVFQFLTHRRHSPPPSSRSSAARAPDFHTPAAAATATAPPHQVERVEVRTLPPWFSLPNASAPGRTTRYIYALRFHWKILVPLEEPHAHRPHTRGYPSIHPPTHPSPVVAVVIVAWGTSAPRQSPRH